MGGSGGTQTHVESHRLTRNRFSAHNKTNRRTAGNNSLSEVITQ